MIDNKEVLILILICLEQISQVRPSIKFDYITPDNCSDNQYYDMNLLICKPCVTVGHDSQDDSQVGQIGQIGQVGLRDHNDQTDNKINNNELVEQSRLQVKSSDGFECVCREGSRVDLTQAGRLSCVRCESGSVSSESRVRCVRCGSSMYVNKTESCQSCHNKTESCQSCHNKTESCGTCHNGYYIERQQENKTEMYCETCPDDMRYDSKTRSCVPCHVSYIRLSGNCTCPPPHRVLDGICVPHLNIKESQSLYTVEYDTLGVRLRSELLFRYYQAGYYNCKYHHNITACQLVANLCVLQHYSYYDKSTYDVNICMYFRALAQSQHYTHTDTPWIYYQTDTRSELETDTLTYKYKIGERVQFVIARYSLLGRLVEFSQLKQSELQLCKENHLRASSGFVIGTNYKQTCLISAKQLLSLSSTLSSSSSPSTVPDSLMFYDLFLKTFDHDKVVLYPVPVLMKNLKKNDVLINDLDSSDRTWQLVRRFYLVDRLSGVETRQVKGYYDDFDIFKSKTKVLRYASDINIEIKFRNEDHGVIYPPLLTIKYDELAETKIVEDVYVEIRFEISYTMSQWKTKQDISITLGVLCCVSVLGCMFRTWSLGRRSGKQIIDLFVLAKFLVTCCGYISNVFLSVNLLAGIIWFITFKNQSVLNILLPSHAQQTAFITFIILSLILKSIQVIHDLSVLATVDIFFIDWERQKSRDTPSVLGLKSKTLINDNDQNEGSLMSQASVNLPSLSSSRPSITQLTVKPTDFPNVTIWRSYFIANEWMELCTYRRLYMPLHVMTVVLLLDYFGFANLATSDIKNSLKLDETQINVPINQTCRIAIGSLTYFGVALLTILIRNFIYDKFISDKLSEFVDLCSVSNISLFSLLSKRYGFYIHGRSPNGRADVNMKEMHELLKREEDDLCSKRGLLPNSDQQTFEMSLPIAVYDHFHKLRSILTGYNQQTSDRMQGVGGNLIKVDVEKVITTYLSINKFLSAFIEHAFKDVDYTVRDKSTIELVLDVEFNDLRDKGSFYNDNGKSFKALLYCGIESTLICFEALLFLVLDICFESFTFAGVLTYIISEIIKRIFLSISRRNLVKKALVDERFLI